MTPLEVVQVYTSLANGGFRARLRAVRAVLDEHGRPLKSFKVQVETAAPPADVYELDRMLMLVTTRGTGRDASARLPQGMVIAGKTGTSSDTRDSWFAGFTGSYLAVVWVGYDDNRVTGLTGAAGRIAGVGRHHGESEARFLRARGAGTRRGSLDRIRGRTRDDARDCSADAVVDRGAEGHGAAGQSRLRAARQPDSLGDKIKAWFKSIVHLRTMRRPARRRRAQLAGCSLFRPHRGRLRRRRRRSRRSPPQPPMPPPAPAPPAPRPPAPPPRENHSLARHPLARDAGAHAGSRTATCDGASSTLDRALRIEPSNPLLWIELGRLRLSENDAHQAEVCAPQGARARERRSRRAGAGGPGARRCAARAGRNQEAREVESQPYMH